jgi:hypothetical protein
MTGGNIFTGEIGITTKQNFKYIKRNIPGVDKT